MIFDRIENADRYAALHPGLAAAFEFLRRPETADLPPGSHEIDGRRVYVDIHRKQGLQRSNITLEAHRKYIDVQYTLAGTDELGWTTTRLLNDVVMEYDPQKDAELFQGEVEAWITLPPETFAVLFPSDAHCAMQGAGELHKAVVKVALDS